MNVQLCLKWEPLKSLCGGPAFELLRQTLTQCVLLYNMSGRSLPKHVLLSPLYYCLMWLVALLQKNMLVLKCIIMSWYEWCKCQILSGNYNRLIYLWMCSGFSHRLSSDATEMKAHCLCHYEREMWGKGKKFHRQQINIFTVNKSGFLFVCFVKGWDLLKRKKKAEKTEKAVEIKDLESIRKLLLNQESWPGLI